MIPAPIAQDPDLYRRYKVQRRIRDWSTLPGGASLVQLVPARSPKGKAGKPISLQPSSLSLVVFPECVWRARGDSNPHKAD